MHRLRLLLLTVALLGALAPAAIAQQREREPIGRFAADVRLAFPRFPDDPAIEDALQLAEDNLPGHGLGLAFGVHVYPFRLGRVTIGVGGELLLSRGSRTLDPTVEGGPDGPTVQTSFSAISPQVSLNFGSRQGWSYVSAGLGRASYTTELKDAPVEDAASSPRQINYGGGARWFASEHVAFTFDLRFYRVDPQAATTGRPAYGGRRMMIASLGISLK